MRVVAWNANYNVHHRSLDDSIAILRPLGADLHVISETGRPVRDSALRTQYIGGVPGLAVVHRTDLHLTAHPENDAVPDLLAGFRVSGDGCLDLLAVWPVSRPGDPSYHEVLMAALDHYSDILAGGRAVMIGDFNSSTGVHSQRRTHPRFVAAARELGLVSLYHEHSGEPHGAESVATYRHSSGANRDFHLDYCFVSHQLLGSARLEILRDETWMGLSDHYPLVLDIS